MLVDGSLRAAGGGCHLSAFVPEALCDFEAVEGFEGASEDFPGPLLGSGSGLADLQRAVAWN